MKLYLLPAGSDLPKFSRQDKLIDTHQSHGFGYPVSLYHDSKVQKASFPLQLSPGDFKIAIRALYERLTDKDFTLSTVDNNRRKTIVPINTTYFKESRYQGTTIIQITDRPVADTIQQEDMPVLAAPPSQRPAVHRPPARQFTLNRPTNQVSLTRPRPWPVSPSRSVNSAPPSPTISISSTTLSLEPDSHPPQSRETPVQTAPDQQLSSPASTPGSRWVVADDTSEVEFNPNIRLRLQQDLEFASSLAMDQDRDTQLQQARLRRDMERLERRRQRETQRVRQQEIRDAVLQEMNEMVAVREPNQLCTIIFTLPTEQQMRHAIPKDLSSEMLYKYVEALTESSSTKLVYCGTVLRRNESLIHESGIQANCRITVNFQDELIVSDVSEDEIEETTNQPPSITEVNDVTEFDQRRLTIIENLLPAKRITVSRNNILQDVLDAYMLDPNLVHHRLEVIFKGESGFDLDGLTREMFALTLQAAIDKYFIGADQKVPRLDHRYFFTGVLETLGRILSHSIVLINYVPDNISPIVYAILGSEECSNDMLMNCFNTFIREDERQLLKAALEMTSFSTETNLKLVNFIGDHDGRTKLTPSNMKEVMLQIARCQLIAKPLYGISSMHRGMMCYPNLWKGITGKMVQQLIEKMTPTSQRLIESIVYQHSDNMVERAMEERVKGHFERYLSSLTPSELSRVLQFWTSANNLCLNTLNIVFNSNDDHMKRPIANTCTATLQISRMYLSFEEVRENFNLYLNSTSSYVFDTL